MPDGSLPFRGGWNRIELIVEDINAEVDRLKQKGLHFRNEIITGWFQNLTNIPFW